MSIYHIDNDFSLQTTLKSLHILYIEDDASIRATISKVLHYFSNTILAVESAEEAMKIYEIFHPDIIICDINLPGINGIEFVKWIRQFDEKSQIFLLSAYTDKEYLFEAVKLSLVDYLTKPIDFTILEKTLKSAARKIVQNKILSVQFITGAIYSYQQRSITFHNEIHPLTAKEVKLLDQLISNKSRMTSKEEIQTTLWEEDMGSESAFKSLVNKLRTKIGKEAIENISGVGYRILLS
ncbi:response regulator transcription factor [Sulfurospirillum halorespirans]|uniref:Response regulator n=1 Tax=Sulfurospirillum halorespirans DSM 13726 TaxID=1193502 RepID=A0A1D7TIA0_9BACT|nr:response regulator transcription factor [Sulfurospirillum halorespirans]AOO64670.1 response regulator [Sulfurospirillum halorespirans DSM 13726]